MLEDQQNLQVTPEELAVIEAALHTQSKILNVQAAAGGKGARARLNEVKRVLARLSQQRPKQTIAKPRSGFGPFWMSRIFG